MKSNIIILSLGFFLLRLTADAQDQGKTVDMLIDVVAWGNDIPGLSLGKPPAGADLIDAQAFRYGKPVKYQGQQLLAIYQAEPPAEVPVELSAEEEILLPRPLVPMDTTAGVTSGKIPELLAERRKSEPRLVALVMLPVDSRRITLLLAPSHQGTFQGHVIDDGAANLTAGKLRVHNLSSHEIALKFGDEKEMHLKSCDASFVETTGKKFATYRLAYLSDDKWKIQESNVLPLSPNEHCQMIILRSNNSFFLSSDGSRSGFLQMVILHRPL